MNKSHPVYYSIALDLAKRIINDEFPVGTKLSGRTLLASQYNVSPETIRKAISFLREANVVTTSQGKEIVVMSAQQAHNYIEHNKGIMRAYSLRQELERLLDKKREIDGNFETIIGEIMRYSDRLKNLTPFNPVEVLVPSGSPVVGKTIGDLRFWQHTGATVIAIRRGAEVIISPGAQGQIQENDRLVVVGSKDIMQKVADFISSFGGRKDGV